MIARAIGVRAIRGFQAEQEIPLSGTLTVIYGENGRGKTSLCEGWNWLFTEEILPGLEPRSEMRAAAQNLHVDLEPRVRLLDETGSVLIERCGDQFDNPANLPQATSPVLLQYRLHQILYSSQGDRRHFFEDVLELGIESACAGALRRACQSVDPFAGEIWGTWKRATGAIDGQGFVCPHTEPVSSDEQRENEGHLLDFLGAYFGCEADPEELEKAVEVGAGRSDLPLDEVALPVTKEVESHIEEARTAIADLDAEAERAYALHQWRRGGLELAEPPRCPFCGELTADEEKLAAIRAAIESAEGRFRSHREAKATFERAVGVILPLARLDVAATLSHLESLRESLADLELDGTEGLLERLDALDQQLRQLEATQPKPEELTDADRFAEFSSIVVEVSRRWLALVPELAKVKEELEKKRVRVKYVEAATSVLQYYRSDREGFYRRLDGGPALAEIAEAAPKVLGRLKEDRLSRLADRIVRFYRILRPRDATPLEQIQPAEGVRGDIRIMARSKDRLEHASALFSYSNANALGMAAHIARVLDAGHATIVLDDPFQSLDSSNREEVIRSLVQCLIEDGIQVVILTHERLAAQELLDHYADQEALGTTLRWDPDNGPITQPMYANGDRQLDVVLAGLERDDPADIVKVTSALRKLIEGLCLTYLEAVGGAIPHAGRQNLGSFIARLEALPQDVRPRGQMILNLKEWNATLAGEAHVDGGEGPGMAQLKAITHRVLQAQGQEKQLRPPDQGSWRRLPRSEGLAERTRRILGDMG